MIRPNPSSHWYNPDGDPAYKATLRDARKEKLYPSVTQIIGILAKPAIESWAVNLMSETCWEHPCDDQYAEETLSDYRSRIEPIYNERRSEAAIRGSAIHDFAENCLTFTLGDPQVSAVPGYEAQCEKLAQWIEDNIRVATAEQSFAHNIDGMGYGGRIDAYGWLNDGQSFVLDFKTQGCKGKPVYYPEWQYQLAAYHAWRKDTFGMLSLGPDGLAITRPDPVCISVVIDTNSPTIHVKYYTPDQISDARKVFKSIMSTWYAIKGL